MVHDIFYLASVVVGFVINSLELSHILLFRGPLILCRSSSVLKIHVDAFTYEELLVTCRTGFGCPNISPRTLTLSPCSLPCCCPLPPSSLPLFLLHWSRCLVGPLGDDALLCGCSIRKWCCGHKCSCVKLFTCPKTMFRIEKWVSPDRHPRLH